ncbi:hypothetical protein ACE180_07675 [Escherichia coli]
MAEGHGTGTPTGNAEPSPKPTFNGLFAVKQTNGLGGVSVAKSTNAETLSTSSGSGSVFDYTFNVSGSTPVSPELRPRNIAFNYIVRAA